MNINVLIEVAGVTNLSRDGHEMVQGLADGARRVESDQHAGYKRDQSAADGQEKADVAGSIRGLRGLVLELGDFVAGLIENGRRLGQPGGRILLEIKNLQVRNGGVAGVHLMALGNQRLREIVRPTHFGAFDLNQSGVDGLVGDLRFSALDEVGHVGKTLVDLLFVAGISAQEKVVHVEAVHHDLVAHRLDGGLAIEGHAGIVACRFRHQTANDIHHHQDTENGQNQAETRV